MGVLGTVFMKIAAGVMVNNCLKCHKEFRTYPSRIRTGFGKFCSYKCSNYGKTPNDYLTESQKKERDKKRVLTIKTDIVRKKISLSRIAENNPNWKGDNVGLTALHQWVKKRLVRSKYCKDCKVALAVDLANISQEYKRDLSDWEWLCRKCHMKKDGRLEIFLSHRIYASAKHKIIFH